MKHSAASAHREKMVRPEQVTTIAPAPSGAGAEILALTEDDFFLLAVRRVVTLPNRLWHATSDAQAADMLMQTPCAVVLIDASLVGRQLEAVIGKLQQQLPDLGFVIAGETGDAGLAGELVDRGLVQGFVVKQEATGKLARVLEAGINRHLELKIETARHAEKPAWKRNAVLGGIAAAVVAGAVGGWFLFSSGKPGPGGDAQVDLTASLRPAEPTVSPVEVELQKAREAFEAGRYIDPKGKSALDFYRAALAHEKNNAEAADGVHRIAEVLLARAEASMLESRPRDAQASVKLARSIEPAHPRIAFLDQQIAREIERTAAVQQEAARLDAQSQRLSSLIRAANDRIAQDKLTEPANDNARHYLMLARDVDSGSVLVTQGLRSLASKLVQKGQQAGARGDMESAEQWIAQARQLGVSGIDYARVERELRSIQKKASEADRLLGLARERLAQGRLLEPENDSARYYTVQLRRQYPDQPGVSAVVESLRDHLLQRATTFAPTDHKVAQAFVDEARNLGASGPAYDAAATLVATARARAEALSTIAPVREGMVLRSYTPEYPVKAQRRRAEGYVDLNFTATVEGDVKDVVVVKAEPQDLFEDAAIKAIRRWKFKPKEVNGQPVEQRLALRISFKLTD